MSYNFWKWAGGVGGGEGLSFSVSVLFSFDLLRGVAQMLLFIGSFFLLLMMSCMKHLYPCGCCVGRVDQLYRHVFHSSNFI